MHGSMNAGWGKITVDMRVSKVAYSASQASVTSLLCFVGSG